MIGYEWGPVSMNSVVGSYDGFEAIMISNKMVSIMKSKGMRRSFKVTVACGNKNGLVGKQFFK